jgi:2-amino-4-hydroxy-6-hydroxymethyldihydropteridine diphosphokinase
MILVGLGANLPSPIHGSPIETLEKCLMRFSAYGFEIKGRSRWFKSAPVPISDDPWYINGVASIHTDHNPRDLLKNLLEIENEFGRVRSEANAPRVLDLDLIAYQNHIIEDAGKIEDKPFCVPHPRMHERAFVLLPINDLNPNWIHPKSKQSLKDLISDLDKEQIIEPID